MEKVVYHGSKSIPATAGPLPVYRNGKELSPQRSQCVRNHSPDGFEWGYPGSGPSQLALALLLDATNSETIAQGYYQEFNYTVIAALGNAWTMTREEIWNWLLAHFSLLPPGELPDVLHQAEKVTSADFAKYILAWSEGDVVLPGKAVDNG